jgi:hypothetical protein
MVPSLPAQLPADESGQWSVVVVDPLLMFDERIREALPGQASELHRSATLWQKRICGQGGAAHSPPEAFLAFYR